MISADNKKERSERPTTFRVYFHARNCPAAHLDVQLADVLADLLFRQPHAALAGQLQRQTLRRGNGLLDGDLERKRAKTFSPPTAFSILSDCYIPNWPQMCRA